MFKKLKERKGFTLAELLVVIAILAILIAIAIPVFSKMVAEANLRVNQANVHSTKSAAVTKILTNLDNKDDSSVTTALQLNAGVVKPTDTSAAAKKKGWIALADVDNAGNITNLRVYAFDGSANRDVSKYKDAIWTKSSMKETDIKTYNDAKTDQDYYEMPADVNTSSTFATVKPTSKSSTSTKARTYYTVQTIITDLDLKAK